MTNEEVIKVLDKWRSWIEKCEEGSKEETNLLNDLCYEIEKLTKKLND